MGIFRNPEVKRLYRILGLLAALFLFMAYLLSQWGVHLFRDSITNNIAAAVGALAEKYPDAEADIMAQLRQADAASIQAGQALLNRYGYSTQNILHEIEGIKSTFNFNTFLFMLLSGSICLALSAVFFYFLARQYRRINEVTDYAKLVQAQDYSLDIRDNSEGDISMLKNEIYKITTMLREQAESLRKEKLGLSNSIADISHQLKTPLTSLFVLNDLLAGDPDPAAKEEFFRRINSQLERMQWLVSSLLKLSKLDAGTAAMKRERVSARKLAERALETLKVQLEQKEIQVINDYSDMEFTADFNWTLEAVTNILKNCAEHTPKGVRISISYESNPIYDAIIISDNGVGIDKEDLPHIFQRFYKGRNASEDSVGIGLAMAKAIVNEQNGDISIKSRPGQGTTFTLKFFK